MCNKGAEPFDLVYTRKTKSQRIKPNDPQDCHDSENPSGNNFSNSVQTIVEFVPDNSALPIAIREGIRSCTKHPISNFVS